MGRSHNHSRVNVTERNNPVKTIEASLHAIKVDQFYASFSFFSKGELSILRSMKHVISVFCCMALEWDLHGL